MFHDFAEHMNTEGVGVLCFTRRRFKQTAHLPSFAIFITNMDYNHRMQIVVTGIYADGLFCIN